MTVFVISPPKIWVPRFLLKTPSARIAVLITVLLLTASHSGIRAPGPAASAAPILDFNTYAQKGAVVRLTAAKPFC